ncbi:MAG TPA: T9SS type A sorting domain-containing protein, partial [Flammeovirgaceae bacterium]|nr:T9SS type A sorting domain-containing protein [Flammeovirgaceae bacterium]
NPDIGADEFDNPQFYAGQDTVFCYYDQNFDQPAWVYDIGRGYDTYQWSNGSDSSAIVIDSQTPLGSTDYIVTVTTASASYTDTVTITYARPQALTQTDYCLNEGQALTITAAPNEAYLWSTGDTTRSITITAWTVPTVTVTDRYGCQNRDTANIESNTHIARLNMPADTAICANQQLVLQANDYANNDVYDRYGFVWNTGDTTQVYTVDGSTTGAGTYLIKVQVINKTTTLGCTTSDSVEVTVKPVADVVLSRDGDDLVVDYTDGTAYTWYWNSAEIASGIITRLTPDKNGDYFVEVVEANVCEARSNTLSFAITGIEEAATTVFHIYPNPSDGNFIIYYPAMTNRPEVMILTAQGRLVYYSRATATQQQVVHLQGLPSGVYLLRIRVDGRVFNQRLLIY